MKAKRKGRQWDANGWCRKTFNVRVRPVKRGDIYAGPIELIDHDHGDPAAHWWLSIDHVEYLIDQLQRAVKRAKR